MAEVNYELFELYLNNQLPEEERLRFENQLKHDPHFRSEFAAYNEVNKMVSQSINREDEVQKFRESLREHQQKYFNTGAQVVPIQRKRRRMVYWTSVAAAAVIFLFIWSPWQRSILSRYGNIEMTNPTVRGSNSDNLLSRASVAFNKKHFENALPLLDSALILNPTDASTLFYKGVTLLNLHQEENARKSLETVFNGQSLYRFKAAYFIALSYLQQKKKDAAIVWLKKIPADADVYSKASRVLQEIL